MGTLAGGAGLVLAAVFFAGPILAIADVIGVAYLISDRRGIRVAFWALFVLSAVGAFAFLVFDERAWWDLARGNFYEPGGPIGQEYAITRIVPWTAGFLLLIPVIRLIARRRF